MHSTPEWQHPANPMAARYEPGGGRVAVLLALRSWVMGDDGRSYYSDQAETTWVVTDAPNGVLQVSHLKPEEVADWMDLPLPDVP